MTNQFTVKFGEILLPQKEENEITFFKKKINKPEFSRSVVPRFCASWLLKKPHKQTINAENQNNTGLLYVTTM